MPDFPYARRVLLEAVAARVFPAAVIEVGGRDDVIWREAFGSLTYEPGAPAASSDTIFDLASLTKVLATTTLAMSAISQGVLTLADPVARWIPEWSGADRQAVTARDLLLHASGLPAWRPLYRTCRSRAQFISAIAATPLERAPGAASLYSDLGFILLGCLLERALGQALDEAFEALAVGVDAGPIRFNPPADWLARIAPTEIDPWRGRLLQGEAHDENAAALGGVAGHSGLFGPVAPVGRLARLWLAASLWSTAPPPFDVPALVSEFTTRASVPASSRALGWDTMLPTSSCGTRMSSRAFGHTGFTGTTVWIDPRTRAYVVLLTNRVHPSRDNDAIRTVRPVVHDAVFSDLEIAR
jgi:CubicO group peptidase (beta-lactamase class C family)